MVAFSLDIVHIRSKRVVQALLFLGLFVPYFKSHRLYLLHLCKDGITVTPEYVENKETIEKYVFLSLSRAWDKGKTSESPRVPSSF